ncbi:MAG: LacI family DNA-binding transcriptional regulator [Candidatus Methylacidiphilales bacterium]|nr:LacI family DNA-binding transcriptional regulator [Candidatus Methylacidiphilales bacterium]
MPRTASPRPNLSMMARRLGVSVPTVWRAMRNAPGIHPETRARALQLAAELGYESPARADGVALKSRDHLVLALTHLMSSNPAQDFITGMNRASLSYNLNILTHQVEAGACSQLLDPSFQPKAMRSGLVDGLVLIHRWPAEVARHLAEKWPAVSIVHHYPGVPMEHVGIDDRQGMLALVEHLHAGGHRQIGFFGFCREMSWACSRLSAWFEALVLCDLPYEPRDVIPVEIDLALAMNEFRVGEWEKKVLERVRKGTNAWVCSSSGTANTLCRFLLEKGFHLPADVAVAGYHRGKFNIWPDLPDITTTEVSDIDLGATAIRRLTNRIMHGNEPTRSILLPAALHLGQTTRTTSKKA